MSMALFADDLTAVVAVVGPALGAAVVWLAGYMDRRRQKAREEQKEDRDEEARKQDVLISRIDSERVEQKQENKRLQDKLDALSTQVVEAKIKAERAVAWIRHLEAALERASIPFRPWVDDPGSATHVPLPAEVGKGNPPSPSSPATGEKT